MLKQWSVPCLLLGISALRCVHAQTPAAASKPGSDVLIFVDGEKLIGHLKSATGSSVVFKSDMAGDVTVEWSKIQELRSSEKFAVIPKSAKLRKSEDTSNVPQGTIAMTDQKIEVIPAAQAAPQTVPLGNASNVVDEAAFQKAFTRSSFLGGWKGGATVGASLTEATQKNQSFSAALNMVRAVPGVNWLDLRSRTIFDYNEAYGKLTTPGSPAIKTSLYHVDAEQDWYLSPRLFAFVSAAFDHNFSQGLKLQQTYGGGAGLVVVKESSRELDFKGSADYIDQQFEVPGLDKKLIGSIFSETYVEKFAHGILFNQQGGIIPAWNNTNAYSAFASAGLTFPVYHRFGLTLGALDNFLNDPPPGFKKNSLQFTLGATYSFQ
ncbi:MAG: DUF481 domain-containing protein [Bryobacteraceae bacterium]